MISKKLTLKNGKVVIIREAQKKDAEQIIEYMNQVLTESIYLTRAPGEFKVTAKEEEDVIADHHKSQNKVFLVACIENQIVSVLTFAGGSKKKKAHSGEFGITVKKDFWRLGIAKLMMESLIEWAKTTKIVRKINLYVHAENEKAINLYKKFNFEIEGTITRDSLINGVFYDSHIMGLRVD